MNVLRDLVYQRIMLLASPHISKEKIVEHVDAIAVAFNELMQFISSLFRVKYQKQFDDRRVF